MFQMQIFSIGCLVGDTAGEICLSAVPSVVLLSGMLFSFQHLPHWHPHPLPEHTAQMKVREQAD